MTTDGDPVIAKLARHATAAVGCVRQCKGRAKMGQQPHVLMLSTAGRSILPGKIAALADAKNLAETLDGEFLLRRIDETEPHRLPSLAKKVAALFRMALVQIAGAGKRPVLYCRDFKLGARHSTLQAQVDLGHPDVPVRIVPCGCDASIRCRRS